MNAEMLAAIWQGHMAALFGRRPPEKPRLPFDRQKAEDLGDKCCAAIMLRDKSGVLLPVTLEEWHGLHKLERDDQL